MLNILPLFFLEGTIVGSVLILLLQLEGTLMWHQFFTIFLGCLIYCIARSWLASRDPRFARDRKSIFEELKRSQILGRAFFICSLIVFAGMLGRLSRYNF